MTEDEGRPNWRRGWMAFGAAVIGAYAFIWLGELLGPYGGSRSETTSWLKVMHVATFLALTGYGYLLASVLGRIRDLAGWLSLLSVTVSLSPVLLLGAARTRRGRIGAGILWVFVLVGAIVAYVLAYAPQAE